MEFVDFDLAKKLKEKGFRELCLAYYTNDDTLYYNYSHKAGACYKDCYISHNLMPIGSVSGKFADAPTISQVLKWLRNKHLLVIPVPSYFNSEGICTGWDCDIWADDNYEHCHRDKKTYEEAAHAGIQYVLDNLI